jgi:tRNA dimethylallyltransferase
MNLPPIFIAGPTAVGKSAIALELAQRLNGEIISVDSMQVYRGLDIGTAKPTLEERKRIPHHLIDVAELDEAFDAAKFCLFAKEAVAEIQSRHRLPIFCGGTGFYFKAFLEGIGDAPPSDPELRRVLEKIPLAELLDELKRTDPAAFDKIDRQNPRRVIRAVEVIRLTGKPFSAQRSSWSSEGRAPQVPNQNKEGLAERVPPNCFGFSRTNSDLHSRINRRVDGMFANGLVAETENLLKRGLEKNPTAMQAIGYRQVVEHLRGQRSLAETIDLVKIRTRQFAKRQFTWFRRQMDLSWTHCDANFSLEAAARQISEAIGSPKFR